MRITPSQYFENTPQQYVENGDQAQPNYTLYFIIISIVAGVALGLAIGAYSKRR